MNSRKRVQRIISAALTSLFMLQQTVMISAFATSITNPNGSPVTGSNGTYTINPTAVISNTDIGLRKYIDFDLSQGDIANLQFKYGTKDVNTFINLVENQVKINGIVNSMRGSDFYNGKAIFVSPNGVVVGASGVLNVGSFGAYTPNKATYEYYRDNPSKDYSALTKLENAGSSAVTVNGKVLAAQDIDIVSSKIDITGKMVANGTDTVSAFNNTLFDQLVNTSNLKAAKNLSKKDGQITLTSGNGTDISGSVYNYGTGVVSVNNVNTNGINITGNVGSNGNVQLTNTGNGGILIASASRVDSNKNIYMNDKSAAGIQHKGLSKADENVEIKANGGNVVIGDRTSNNNYITAGKNIDINVVNGNIRNFEGEQSDAAVLKYNQGKTLLVADGDLNMDVTNGTIGLKVGDNCTGGYCTGISNAATTRDYAKSVNGNIKGAVTAKTTDTTAAKQNDYVINYAALNSDMKINAIKADGRVILTTDYNQNDGVTRYDMLNASKNAAKPNVEGYGLSLIASGNIGSDGTNEKALTFNQTKPGALRTAGTFETATDRYGMDVLANEDVIIMGLDDEYAVNNVCSMISREGKIDAQFAGNVYIDEVTSEDDLNIIARGKSVEINHLGTVPRTPVDYFGPRTNGLADNPNLPNGGYTGVGEKDAIPNNATVKALDINKTIRPNGTYVDNGHYGYADSVVRINDGKLDNGKLDVVADNIYANGVAAHFNKDGFSKEPDPSTSKIDGTNSIPTGHAVRPDDVTGIGHDEKERNYYYPQGDGDGIFDGVPSNVDPDDGIVDATPLAITDAPTSVPTSTPTTAPTSDPTSAPTSAPTDAPTGTPTSAPTDAPTGTPTDAPTGTPTDAPTSAPTDAPTGTPTSAPTDAPTDAPTGTPTSAPTDAPTNAPTDIPTSAPTDAPTNAPSNAPTNAPTTDPNDDGRVTYIQRKILDNAVDTIDKRQYVRYNVSTNQNPISLEQNSGVESLLDVSRGGVSVTHNNDLKVGDVIPVHMKYGALDIKANAKVVSATTHRAGAQFVNLDQATANQLLYLNMVLDEVNKVSLR